MSYIISNTVNIRLLRGASSAALVLATCACASSPHPHAHEARSAEAMFRPGKAALDRGDYDRAVRDFQNLQAEYPYGPYAEQAQLDTAYAYYKQGDSKAAVAAAEAFIKAHPVNPHVDYAWYLKGLAQYQAIEGAEFNPQPDYAALQTFRYLAETYPKTTYALSARLHIAKIIDILGERNLRICKFYFIRHAYVAAANRCVRVIRDYQLSPARNLALYYLARSYRYLDLMALARTTAIILHRNAPSAPQTQKLRALWQPSAER
ncbi:MAG: outer membrane protein assembly factor BamD [Acidithiobacillus sp.]